MTLPAAPSRTMDQDTFDTTTDAFIGALPQFEQDMNAVQVAALASQNAALVSQNAALASELAAAASALSANGAAGAQKWVSGNSYGIGVGETNTAWSPSNYLTYRKITALSVSTIDPSADPTNWALVFPDVGQITAARQFAQSVDLASSASVGTLSAADNANLDVGIYNFTLVWTGSLPDWTPSANVILLQKHDGSTGYILTLLTTGVLRLTLNATTYDSTVAIGLTDGATATVAAIVARESTSAAGSIVFKVGEYALGAIVTITSSAPATLDNASSLYVSGTSATRYATRNHAMRIFNRALTDAGWGLFIKNGVAFSDIWGSQTTLNVSSMDAGTFDSSSGLSATGGTFTKSTVGTKACGTADEIVIEIGKNYLVTFNASLTGNLTAASVFLRNSVSVGTVSNAATLVSGSNVMLLTATGTTTGVVGFSVTDAQGTAGDLVISDLRVVRTGAIANYEPFGIQPNQWHDSANDNHLAFPSSGASLSQWKETGQYSPTVAVTGDTTFTLPAGWALESVLCEETAGNAVDVRLGTTAGGTDIFAATTVPASLFKPIQAPYAFSRTADAVLYFSSALWNSASLKVTIYFRRIS